MKDRRKREVISWSSFFWCTIFVVFACVFFTGFTFSTFRLFHDTFHPILVSRWTSPAMEAISGRSSVVPAVAIRDSVAFPDQMVFFLRYRPSVRLLFTKEDLDCVFWSNSTVIKRIPATVGSGECEREQIVRCPVASDGENVSLTLKSGVRLPCGGSHSWNSLAYEALIDRDNSTIVFAKGLNLKAERSSDASRFECVYGWDFWNSRFVLRSSALSVAQEIIRCRTPRSVLSGGRKAVAAEDLKVSVRVKGGAGVLPSIARTVTRLDPRPEKEFEMCVCSMVRNQAQYMREWVMYHSRIGIRRWFIYDNNSEDDMDAVIASLAEQKYNITRHVWPWIKTQEAGFAHCSLRARASCEWVGFIDVDEFFHLPSGMHLSEALQNLTGSRRVGEIRVRCHSFGPSGLTRAPDRGVTVGYTCRMGVPERHKSIVRPDELNASLINVVHHFHLRDGVGFVDSDRSVLVINHYKYQVWDVFKEKFYRRVATYVADWQDEENAGSKDRAPGLGTKPVEPPDWPTRFCEVTDTGLRDRVLAFFSNPKTKRLPWQHERSRHNPPRY